MTNQLPYSTLITQLTEAGIAAPAAQAIVAALIDATHDRVQRCELETIRSAMSGEITHAITAADARITRELHTIVNRGTLVAVGSISSFSLFMALAIRIFMH